VVESLAVDRRAATAQRRAAASQRGFLNCTTYCGEATHTGQSGEAICNDLTQRTPSPMSQTRDTAISQPMKEDSSVHIRR
jgi:hypothetical protein